MKREQLGKFKDMQRRRVMAEVSKRLKIPPVNRSSWC